MSSEKTLYFFIRHIGNMITASGTKRIGYALANILLMGLGVASAYGFVYFINTLGDINFFASIMLLIFLGGVYNILFHSGFSGAGDSGRRRFYRLVPRRRARRQHCFLYNRAFVSCCAYSRLGNSALVNG